MRASALFPFLRWRRPTAQTLGKDAWAGISVSLVLIPQSLAYATLAGLPPEIGLYAALLPSVVGVLWGSSSLLATGPVALTSLLTFASLQPFASPGSSEWIDLAIWLAIYSGVMQFLLGALRMGVIANFVSHPVITGFTNAAALIIIGSQLPAIFGLPLRLDAAAPAAVAAALQKAPAVAATTSAFGLMALALLVVQKRVAPWIPGVLLVCIVGIAVSYAYGFAAIGGGVVGTRS